MRSAPHEQRAGKDGRRAIERARQRSHIQTTRRADDKSTTDGRIHRDVFAELRRKHPQVGGGLRLEACAAVRDQQS
jgi:hypothetical protein